MMSDKLLAAMTEAGVMPALPLTVNSYGEIQRFQVASDKSNSLNGWIISYSNNLDDGVFVFGSWKDGTKHTFSQQGYSANDPTLRLKVESARREALKLKEYQQMRAANNCFKQWQKAEPAERHPYLSTKKIEPHTARVDADNWLLIPVITLDGCLSSLQFISPNGGKSFKKGGKITGCFCPIGYEDNSDVILICEGFATGATLREASYLPVIVAFNAGNLKTVSETIRLHQPNAKIIICADNDHTNQKQNVGLIKGEQAAKQAGALLTYPNFASNDDGTDFNDMACSYGLGSVKAIIMEVVA
jgi:putative DNA primase/helicase